MYMTLPNKAAGSTETAMEVLRIHRGILFFHYACPTWKLNAFKNINDTIKVTEQNCTRMDFAVRACIKQSDNEKKRSLRELELEPGEEKLRDRRRWILSNVIKVYTDTLMEKRQPDSSQ